jgi:hypothetical protein
MYLVAIFEKRAKDLVIVPEDEKEIYTLFSDDINAFMERNKTVFTQGQLIKIPFHSYEKVGVEIYKI